MKLKKIISSTLIFGLFLNTSLYSYASVSLDNERYEMFTGNDILISDIIEENKVDVEIEGNTMVNLVKNTTWLIDDYHQYIYTTDVIYNPVGKVVTLINLSDKVIHFSMNNSDVLGKDGNWYANVNLEAKSKKVINIPEGHGIRCINGAYSEGWTSSDIDNIKNKVILLEGDYSNTLTPLEYFEGMKSFGQNDENGHKFEVLSKNKNLLDISTFKSQKDNTVDLTMENGVFNFIAKGTEGKETTSSQSGLNLKVYLEKGKTYYVDYKTDGVIGGEHGSDTVEIFLLLDASATKPFFNIQNPRSITVGTTGWYYVRFDINKGVGNYKFWDLQITEGNQPSAYTPYSINKKEILLNEPLRELPNGVKDKIIKKNGQWVVERNVAQLKLNGSEYWRLPNVTDNYNKFVLHLDKPSMMNYMDGSIKNVTSDKFVSLPANDCILNDIGGISSRRNNNSGGIIISISNKICPSIEEFKNWLSINTPEVIYELKNPIYEPLNIDLLIQLYEEVTYISNNSTIPTNMKVTIDRTANKAQEAVELAKINPTVENLSRARSWINLLKDSILKDQLQSEVNNIINIEDMVLERKTATSNVDIYIKSENMLSMKLDTNSVSFDNFSGVDDMEKQGAINITINSSLPYQLNAYLPAEIQNSNTSNVMNKDVLNIKESTEEDYKTFSDINEKLMLKDNCKAGNDKNHSIDLILKGGIAHEKDVYKAIIKFEAEQK